MSLGHLQVRKAKTASELFPDRHVVAKDPSFFAYFPFGRLSRSILARTAMCTFYCYGAIQISAGKLLLKEHLKSLSRNMCMLQIPCRSSHCWDADVDVALPPLCRPSLAH